MESTDVARGRSRVRPGGSTLAMGTRLYVGVVFCVLAAAGALLILLPASILDPVTSIDSMRTGIIVGIGILALDAIAPVPSSAVMIALGATIGLGPATVVSTLGLTAAALLGYLIGRAGGRVGRLSSLDTTQLTEAFGRHRGVTAVIATRPIPVLAESTATVAGITRMPLAVFTVAAIVGSFAPALVYAIVGAGLATQSLPLIAIATATMVMVALGVRRLIVR